MAQRLSTQLEQEVLSRSWALAQEAIINNSALQQQHQTGNNSHNNNHAGDKSNSTATGSPWSLSALEARVVPLEQGVEQYANLAKDQLNVMSKQFESLCQSFRAGGTRKQCLQSDMVERKATIERDLRQQLSQLQRERVRSQLRIDSAMQDTLSVHFRMGRKANNLFCMNNRVSNRYPSEKNIVM